MRRTPGEDFAPRPPPGDKVLEGRHVRLEPLDWTRHRDGLFAALGGEANAETWRYMPSGPYASAKGMAEGFGRDAVRGGFRTLTVLERGTIVGTASYMRLRPEHGSVEVGAIAYAPGFRRTVGATEAMWLMARHTFDLGYRRYEWKCDDRNAASMRAAERLGFTYEGMFRQDMVVKGENRDTAWFSILDCEWPAVEAALRAWLDPANFDAKGCQRRRLEAFRAGTREGAALAAPSVASRSARLPQ